MGLKKNHITFWTSVICQIGKSYLSFLRALVTQTVKNLPSEQEIWVQSLGQEDPLEKGMVTWRMPWTEESGGLQSMGPQRAGHD